jgi:23S rRNA (guanine1835-N2)-methyltransferase
VRYLSDLFQTIAHRVEAPVAIALGSPRPVAHLCEVLAKPGTVCFQMDLHQGEKLRRELSKLEQQVEVVVSADLWDLEAKFNTVLFPAQTGVEADLKLDMIEQAYHILKPDGKLITLSEYERDNRTAKWHKKVFGKCGESPSSKQGTAFWSSRGEDISRRRHEVNFHAKLGDSPSMDFISRPGTFSYGRFDDGSRALIEVAPINPGDRVLDLGSGCGAIGCLAWNRCGPTGHVGFVDSSLRAVALSELNAAANGVANRTVHAAAMSCSPTRPISATASSRSCSSTVRRACSSRAASFWSSRKCPPPSCQ